MNKPVTPKQPLSVYTVMLIISTLLMLAACILMFVELYRYGSPWDKPSAPPRAMVEMGQRGYVVACAELERKLL